VKTWQAAQYANIVRHIPPGIYYARLRVKGKLIWRSLKTDKILSARQAGELPGWLDARQANGTAAKRRRQPRWRRGTARQRMKRLKAWEESNNPCANRQTIVII